MNTIEYIKAGISLRWSTTKVGAASSDGSQATLVQRGFTIVELLIAIVVIAILAAITTVVYGNIQQRARDSVVQQDLRNFASAVEMLRLDDGHYPSGGVSSLSRLEFRASHSAYPSTPEWNFDYCVNSADGRTQYILFVAVDDERGYYVSSNNSTPREFAMSAPRSNPSPCYTGHSNSAADEAGLTNISSGLSGYRPTGWADWTR